MSATHTAESTSVTQTPPKSSNAAKRSGGSVRKAAPASAKKAAPVTAQPRKAPAKPLQESTGDTAGAQHPLVLGLFQMLPPAGTPWTLEQAVSWMEAAAVNLRVAYGFTGAIAVVRGTAAA
jgi:hypothetical protein